jgi:hypothetical protein
MGNVASGGASGDGGGLDTEILGLAFVQRRVVSSAPPATSLVAVSRAGLVTFFRDARRCSGTAEFFSVDLGGPLAVVGIDPEGSALAVCLRGAALRVYDLARVFSARGGSSASSAVRLPPVATATAMASVASQNSSASTLFSFFRYSGSGARLVTGGAGGIRDLAGGVVRGGGGAGDVAGEAAALGHVATPSCAVLPGHGAVLVSGWTTGAVLIHARLRADDPRFGGTGTGTGTGTGSINNAAPSSGAPAGATRSLIARLTGAIGGVVAIDAVVRGGKDGSRIIVAAASADGFTRLWRIPYSVLESVDAPPKEFQLRALAYYFLKSLVVHLT